VNSAVFSVVHAVVFQPKGYAEPEQVVQLYSQNKKNPNSYRIFSYPTFQDIRQQNTVLTDVMAHNQAMIGIGEKGNTRRTMASLVSWNYFSVSAWRRCTDARSCRKKNTREAGPRRDRERRLLEKAWSAIPVSSAPRS
jgi:hypothetical protein